MRDVGQAERRHSVVACLSDSGVWCSVRPASDMTGGYQGRDALLHCFVTRVPYTAHCSYWQAVEDAVL